MNTQKETSRKSVNAGRRFRGAWLALIATVAALLALPAFASAAQTLKVNGASGADTGSCVDAACKTIGYAITKAAAGDTIQVAAGAYPEKLTINKPLTLEGELGGGTEIAPATKTGVLAGSTITLEADADGTVLRDLEIESRAQSQPAIATTGGSAIDDVTIEGVEQWGLGSGDPFHPNPTPTTVAAGLKIAVPAAGWQILDSSFASNYMGVQVSGNAADMEVLDSSFNHDRSGFYVERTTPLGPSSTGTIDGLKMAGCLFLEDQYRGLYFEGLSEGEIEDIQVRGTGAGIEEPRFGAVGIQLNLKAGDYGPISITESTVSGSQNQGVLIQVRGYSGDTPYEGAGAATLDSVLLEGMQIVDNGGPGVAVTNEPNLGEALIAGSRIVDNGPINAVTHNPVAEDGIWTFDAAGDENVESIDNWFGCNAGPGATGCDTVSAPVDEGPWLVLTATAGSSVLAPGGSTPIRAAIDSNSAGQSLGEVPGGTPVSFAATNGSIDPEDSPLFDGEALATFTAGVEGSAAVTATVDNQTVAVPLTVKVPVEPPVEVPTEKPAEGKPAESTPTPAPAPAPTPPAPPVTIEPTETKTPPTVSSSGNVTVATVGCASSSCQVEAKKPTITIGGQNYKIKVKVPDTVAGGSSAPVKVILPKKVREALEEKGKGKVKVRLTVTTAEGQTKTVTVTVTVKAKKGKKK